MKKLLVIASIFVFCFFVGSINNAYAGKSNKTKCKEWCASAEGQRLNCDHCRGYRACGRGYTSIKSFRGRGKNWHACTKTQRQIGKEENKRKCKEWCNGSEGQRRGCTGCSTKPGCGVHQDRLKKFNEFKGKNWYACKSIKDDLKKRAESWCRARIREPYKKVAKRCGNGYIMVKRFRGRGKNYSCCVRMKGVRE